jgi:hypothetical protein
MRIVGILTTWSSTPRRSRAEAQAAVDRTRRQEDRRFRFHHQYRCKLRAIRRASPRRARVALSRLMEENLYWTLVDR